MQAQMPGNHPETSMYDEVSNLLKTRLEYHEWQLKHHQQRVNEIQDMYQYLNVKFGPQPAAAQPEPVVTMTDETTAAVTDETPVAAGETEQQPEAAQEETVADESLLRPYTEGQTNGHEGGQHQHQPMY